MLGLIEAGLTRPWHRLRLPPELEARFVAQGSIGDARRIRSWLLVFAFFNVISLKVDFDRFGSDAFAVPAALTLGLVIPITLLTILALRGSPSLRLQTGAVLATSVVTMGVTLNSARLIPSPEGDVYLILAAIVPLVIGMIAPMTFRHSLVYCGICLATYLGALVLFSLGSGSGLGVALLVSSLILVPLKLSFSREWETKQGYLLGLRDQLRFGALVRDNDRLTILSETDALTGIANRRVFDQRLAAAWSDTAASNDWLGLAFVDVDHFKALNDAAGHEAGDRCLRAIASALSIAAARYGGFPARYGGEEFAVVFPGCDPETSLEAAEALHDSVRALAYAHPGLPNASQVSVCVGTTCAHAAMRAHAITVESLRHAADIALYEAKRGGRDRVGVATVRTHESEAATTLAA